MKGILLFLVLTLSSIAKAQKIEDYIAANVYHAQYLMQRNGLPASIILGVAIHESAAGKSKIARYLNNHFGVKGPNSSTEITSAYRDYPSVDSSYKHFVFFIRGRKHFNVLFDRYDPYDYKNWAYGIHRGGYASSRTWASQVVAIIKKYELFQYDNRPDNYLEVSSTAAIAVKKSSAVAKKSNLYTVKSGDNLSSIAKKTNTTVSALMQKNGLKSSALKLGQKIIF